MGPKRPERWIVPLGTLVQVLSLGLSLLSVFLYWLIESPSGNSVLWLGYH